MPLPGHRLDLLMVGLGEGAGARVEAAFADLVGRRVVRPDGGAAEESGWLVSGGFVRAVADIHERPRLWANQAGGFRVRCPACGTGLVRELSGSLADGDPVPCPACGRATPIQDLDYAPPAAWGAAALVLRDVGTAELTPAGADWAAKILGKQRMVWRRP